MNGTTLTASEICRRVVAAHERRLEAGLGADTNAYRIVHDQYDGLPWLRVDRLGDYAMIKYRHEHWTTERPAMELVRALKEIGLKGAAFVYDARSKESASAADARDSMLNGWLGELEFRAPKETILATENRRRYALSLSAGFSCGLFFDMRGVRHDLAKRWVGKRVLNLFAYTCGFGVALGRSCEVTNVDVSSRYLDWGRNNYALNGLAASDEHFVRKDAFEYLEIAKKKQNLFDAIILDPPSYSAGKRGRSRRFSLRSDLPELVGLALDALASGGELVVAINYESISWQKFETLVLDNAAPRGKRVVQRWGPGPDFPAPEDEYHLKTARVQ